MLRVLVRIPQYKTAIYISRNGREQLELVAWGAIVYSPVRGIKLQRRSVQVALPLKMLLP